MRRGFSESGKPKVLFGWSLSCCTVTTLFGYWNAAQKLRTGGRPRSRVPGERVFGQFVLCFTAQLLGTAIATFPYVYVFHPDGIETVEVVIVEPLHADKSNVSPVRAGKSLFARRNDLRSLSVIRRAYLRLRRLTPNTGRVNTCQTSRGPLLRLDALDYRRQSDEALATGAAISRRRSDGTWLHQHSHSDSRLHGDYTAGVGKPSPRSVAGEGHFRYGGP